MVVLLDRNFAVQGLIEAIASTGAQVLVLVKEHRRLPAPNGSYLSRLGAVPVRVVDREITVSTSQRRRTGIYRLVPPLTAPRSHPAAEQALPRAPEDRDLQTTGVFTDTTVDPVEAVGHRLLAGLMPDRRVRTRPRVVERAVSKHTTRRAMDRTTCKTTIGIDI